MNCPYCNHPDMPMSIPNTPRPFIACPSCGKKSRVSISPSSNGKPYIKFSAVGSRNKPRKKDYHVREYAELVEKTGMTAQKIFEIGVLKCLEKDL